MEEKQRSKFVQSSTKYCGAEMEYNVSTGVCEAMPINMVSPTEIGGYRTAEEEIRFSVDAFL